MKEEIIKIMDKLNEEHMRLLYIVAKELDKN